MKTRILFFCLALAVVALIHADNGTEKAHAGLRTGGVEWVGSTKPLPTPTLENDPVYIAASDTLRKGFKEVEEVLQKESAALDSRSVAIHEKPRWFLGDIISPSHAYSETSGTLQITTVIERPWAIIESKFEPVVTKTGSTWQITFRGKK